MIFEFQSQHDPDKPKVLQLETMIFLCHAADTNRDGGEFLPLAVFVYLKGTCPQRVVSVRTPSGLGFTGEPAIWEIAGDSAVDALAKVETGEYSWGALFWVSLMAGASEESVIAQWRRLRDEKVPEKRRADVTYIASQFAELAGCKIAWERVKEGVKMTESAIANEMIELGKMSMARDALLDVIKLRFPEVLTPDVENAIADQPSLDVMNTWRKAAFDPNTTAETFLAVLRR